MRNDELTPEERDALAALPRERRPPRVLEERIVGALRERGILRTRRGIEISFTPARMGWVAAAMACLVLVGFVLGQSTAPGTALPSIPTRPDEDGLRLAAYVQQLGSTYVRTLRDLTDRSPGIDSFALKQAREAAVASFYAASHEVARLAPEDPAAQTIRNTLIELAETGRTRTEHADRILWF